MVFIWSQLTKGDANYTLVQVSINDIIMLFAFAPLAAVLLGITDIIANTAIDVFNRAVSDDQDTKDADLEYDGTSKNIFFTNLNFSKISIIF